MEAGYKKGDSMSYKIYSFGIGETPNRNLKQYACEVQGDNEGLAYSVLRAMVRNNVGMWYGVADADTEHVGECRQVTRQGGSTKYYTFPPPVKPLERASSWSWWRGDELVVWTRDYYRNGSIVVEAWTKDGLVHTANSWGAAIRWVEENVK